MSQWTTQPNLRAQILFRKCHYKYLNPWTEEDESFTAVLVKYLKIIIFWKMSEFHETGKNLAAPKSSFSVKMTSQQEELLLWSDVFRNPKITIYQP